MADHLPKFSGGSSATFTASAAITGGQVVEVTGNRTVGPGTAASAKAIGTAAHDAASGAKVVVHLPGPVDTAVSAAAILAGAKVESAAAGKIQTATTGYVLGIALTAAGAGDEVVEFVR